MLKNLAKTVQTPSKCPGLVAPSKMLASALGAFILISLGYIWLTLGKNIAVAPAAFATSMSCASSLG